MTTISNATTVINMDMDDDSVSIVHTQGKRHKYLSDVIKAARANVYELLGVDVWPALADRGCVNTYSTPPAKIVLTMTHEDFSIVMKLAHNERREGEVREGLITSKDG